MVWNWKNHFGALKYHSSIYMLQLEHLGLTGLLWSRAHTLLCTVQTKQDYYLQYVEQDKTRHQRLTVSGIKLSEWVGEWFYCSQDATIRTYTHTKIPFVWPLYLDREKAATSFLPSILACLNPSAKRSTSAISSLSGLDMATGRNSCFRLSGSFCRPP